MDNKIPVLVLFVVVCFVSAKGGSSSSSSNDDGIYKQIKPFEHFVLVKKVAWDYLPKVANLADDDDAFMNDMLMPGPDRIGHVYFKYLFFRYTDDTYTVEIPKPPHRGCVGPLFHAQLGDVLQVHLRNEADIPVSMHPHGALYLKGNEGAFYSDGTYGFNKTDDEVQPNTTRCLIWQITEDFVPTKDDPPCIFMGVHSHRITPVDVNSGLIAGLVVCKKGVLNEDRERTDVDKEIMIFADSFDEGDTWLTDENLDTCLNCRALYNSGDEDFAESLKKDALNCYMFGNLPGLDICLGERVVWYFYSLEAEIHPIHISGHTLNQQYTMKSVLGIFSATFQVATTVSTQPGVRLISCLNEEHNSNGMRIFMTVRDCNNYTVPVTPPPTHITQVFIKAEDVDWSYGVSGMNLYDGGSLTDPTKPSFTYFENTADRIGDTYVKSLFVEYTDATFAVKKVRHPDEEHLGFLGPLIKAQEGEAISVTVSNTLSRPVSFYMQGVEMDKANDGTYQKDPSTGPPYTTMMGKLVASGGQETYYFTVPHSVAPLEDDPPCKLSLYYSHWNFDKDVYTGLVGPVLICKKKSLKTTKSGRRVQKGVKKEIILFYSSTNENMSWNRDVNIARFAPGVTPTATTPEFDESNIMRAINGHAYGNLPRLSMCRGDKVIWHVASFGQGEGLHTAKWTGNTVNIDGINVDSHVTISSQTFSAVMNRASNAGTWSISCHNNQHFTEGMKGLYTVKTCGNTKPINFKWNGKTRVYHVGIVEEEWDYSPQTIHPVTLHDYSIAGSEGYDTVRTDGINIGSKYKKAMYREFTDGTFTIQKPHPEHLGMMGPYIRAEVNEKIRVILKNMATRPYSFHASLLRYNKDNEGMSYLDGVGPSPGDEVAAGATYTYEYQVPSTSGPGKKGPKCVGALYQSAVDPVRDVYSGLVGPLVICKKNTLGNNNMRTDGWKEFAVLFFILDENRSWYINENSNNLAQSQWTDEFIGSNIYDSINGRIFVNLKGLTMYLGDTVQFYIFGMGDSNDVHTAHFHGQMFTYKSGTSHLGDVMEVFPGTYKTVVMKCVNKGIWLLHCHVGEHLIKGMVTVYTVL